MLLFAHVGITAAAAKVSDIAFPAISGNEEGSGLRHRISSLLNRLRDGAGKLDYRMIIIGSMLPDIIDKPLFLLLRDRGVIISGRGYTHTLLFSLILIIMGLFMLLKEKRWVLILGLASLTHIILDWMWDNPVTLFWPLLGPITGGNTEDWLSNIWENLFKSPDAYIPEIIGLIFTAYFAYTIIRDRRISDFIRTGVLERT